jgi:hypothetical protein
VEITTESEINLPENHKSSEKSILWSVARINNTWPPKIGFTQKNTSYNKFYNSLKADLIVFCKNNHAKNKDLIATRPVAFEKYSKYPSNKIGLTKFEFLNPQILIYHHKIHFLQV